MCIWDRLAYGMAPQSAAATPRRLGLEHLHTDPLVSKVRAAFSGCSEPYLTYLYLLRIIADRLVLDNRHQRGCGAAHSPALPVLSREACNYCDRLTVPLKSIDR